MVIDLLICSLVSGEIAKNGAISCPPVPEKQTRFTTQGAGQGDNL